MSHLSDLVLDRLLTGEELPPARVHLDGCAECRARLAALDADAQNFRRTAPIAQLAASTRRRLRPRSRRWVYAATTALAAAAMLIVIARGPDRVPDLRAKGGLSLDVFRKRGTGSVETLVTPARVSPGDALRFGVETAQAGYAAVLSVDGAGAVSVYYPQAAELPPIAAGALQLLDGSIELDETPGRERLFALVCRRALRSDDVRATLVAALNRAAGDARKIDAARLSPDCAATSFWLEKVTAR